MLERTETSLRLDRPTCGAGNGDSVALTFSVMRGPSGGLSVDAKESLSAGWLREGILGSGDFCAAAAATAAW